MRSQYEMQFPFTKQDEILYWATLYTKNQKPERQHREEDVIKIREKVETRKKPETPEGYLLTTELRKMAQWKSHYLPSKIDNNPPGLIEDVTGEAFRLDNDWEKIKKLKNIEGVSESVASVILHLYDQERYPVLDRHALWSLTIDHRKVDYDEPFWKKYVKFCRAKADCHSVCMRTLDRALYKFSQSGAASALKTITDEMFFLELTRRGYNISRDTREDTTSAGIINIG